MYAIQTGTKWIKPEQFMERNSIFNLVVSANPKIFATQKEAEDMLSMTRTYLAGRIQNTEAIIAQVNKVKATAERDIARITAQIEALEVQPYKEVVTKIRALEKKAAAAGSRLRGAIDQDYRRDLARYQRILESNPRVVKIQQTVIAETA